MPDLVSIITNVLNSYGCLPDFTIKELKQIDNTIFYACYFENRITINFRYPQDGFTGKLLGVYIYEQYIKESQEYGMNIK